MSDTEGPSLSRHDSVVPVASEAKSDFPSERMGKKVLLATESLGPVNGVSRTTQSLVDYLRAHGVHVATCAPCYTGQPITANSRPERLPIVNRDWTRSIEAKAAALGSRAIGGAWSWPTLLNFQTDLAAYAGILFAPPIDRYGAWLLHIVRGFLFRAAAVHTIFYPSAYVRTYMEGTGAPAEKMIQLGRGVDSQLFNPNKREDAYRLASTFSLKQTGLNFTLLTVGGNQNPAVVNEVQSYFSDIKDQVLFAGMLRGDELAKAYAAADVFLHCAITETFGPVVLEPMASGVPVVARDEGGPSETVKHGRSGYLVPPSDLDTFVKYAHRLGTDHALRSEMIDHAREQALDTTWDKVNSQVALRLTDALRHSKSPRDSVRNSSSASYYGTWPATFRVYLAVGLVWIFWLIVSRRRR